MDSGLMNAMGVVVAGDSLINALSEIDQASFASKQFEFNADMAKIQGEEAITQGKFEQQISQEKTGALSGQQVAAEAAQGGDVHTGTAELTREQTGEIGGLDYLTIGNNAMMKAIGFEIQGENDKTQEWQATNAGTNKAMNSLLSGAEETMQLGFKAQSYDIPQVVSGEDTSGSNSGSGSDSVLGMK